MYLRKISHFGAEIMTFLCGKDRLKLCALWQATINRPAQGPTILKGGFDALGVFKNIVSFDFGDQPNLGCLLCLLLAKATHLGCFLIVSVNRFGDKVRSNPGSPVA